MAAALVDLAGRLPVRVRRLRGFAPLTLVALLGPASLYGFYKMVDVGGLPRTAAQRQAWLVERFPGYGLLDELAEGCARTRPESVQPEDDHHCVVYLLARPRLRWYVPEVAHAIGDHLGRYPHEALSEVRGRPDRVRHLLVETWGVDYLLLSSVRARVFERQLPGVQRIAEDHGTVLLRLR